MRGRISAVKGIQILPQQRHKSGPLVFALMLCGATAALAQSPLGPAKAVAAKLASTRKIFGGHPSLQTVSVLQGKTSVEVHIEGSAALNPLTTRLDSPERIIIDLPDVRYGSTKHIPVNAGDVGEVRIGLYRSDPPTTRIVVELTHPHAYRVLASGKTVILQIDTAADAGTVRNANLVDARVPSSPVAPVQQEPPTPPQATGQQPSVTGEERPQIVPPEPMPIPQVATVYVAPPLPSASAPAAAPSDEEETTPHQAAKGNQPGMVKNIAVGRDNGAVEINIEANKPLRASAITLRSPERIVVDIADIRFERPKRIPVNVGDVRDVIVALYMVNPLTTRVVVNLGRAHAYHLVNSGNTLTVRIETEAINAAEQSAR